MSCIDLPIAMLHHVSDREDWDSIRPFVINNSTFTRFLDVIEKREFQTLTFDEIAKQKKHGRKSIVISFDDCGKHLWDFAIPELVRRNMKAVFFMPTAYIGGLNDWNIEQGKSAIPLMNESDLRELEKIGMEVGGHSHHHIRLGTCEKSEVLSQFAQCQNILTSILGHPVHHFAYPFGSIPENAEQILHNHGFKSACAIFSPQQLPHQMRRFIVHNGDSQPSLSLKISPIYQHYRSLTDSIKSPSAWK